MHILIIVTSLIFLAYLLIFKRKKHPPIETINSEFEKEISKTNFNDMVLETSTTTPVLADFYADWCPPCRYLTPLLAEMANEYQGSFLLAKINAEKNKELKEKFKINGFPTVILFKDREIVERFTGGKLEHTLKFTLAKHGIHAPNSET